MNLTKTKLYQLIQEALLNELFDSTDHYEFEIDDGPNEGDFREEYGEVTFEMKYKFEAEGNIIYHVKFAKDVDEKDMTSSDENYVDNSKGFEVAFDADGSMQLTNKLDMKVYITIIAIIQDFVNNHRPNFKIQNFHNETRFWADAVMAFEHDDRRARIYAYMLEKNGAKNIKRKGNFISWEIPLNQEEIL